MDALLNERGADRVLRRKRVAASRDDRRAELVEHLQQTGRLGLKVEAGADDYASQRLHGSLLFGYQPQNGHILPGPLHPAVPLGGEIYIRDLEFIPHL